MARRLILLAAWAWAGACAALPMSLPVPGGLIVLEIDAPAELVPRFGDRPVLTVDGPAGQRLAIVGIPLSTAPGRHELVVGEQKLAFDVLDKAYAEERLTIPNERMVNPLPEDLERIAAERPRIIAAARHYSERAPATLRLLTPVPGPRSSAFGLRRFLNEQARNPHAGIDIAAPTGTPISAAGPGRVIEAGGFYFNGNTVWVDHGRGMITMYCHMDRIDVATGQEVAAGDLLGTVGATGRVTGAHLHFVVMLNGTMVDPDLFLY